MSCLWLIRVRSNVLVDDVKDDMIIDVLLQKMSVTLLHIQYI